MEPRLLQSLRLAMATLYSLPLQQHYSQGNASPKEAHDFLVTMQSRNVRRKILSAQQRWRDQHNRGGQTTTTKHQSVELEDGNSIIHMGSSWLAFLAVLCQMNEGKFVASPPERLFAAQSVLHRARRNKLVDAIDLEVERDDIDQEMALNMYHDSGFVLPLVDAYRHLVARWNPFISAVLSSYHPLASSVVQTEERIKGEMMLLTLACVAYITACEPETTPLRTPILEALGSAISALTLRVRYINPSEQPGLSGSFSDQGMVWIISLIFKLVFDHAQHYHPDPGAWSTSLALTLGALPDTILGSPGGSRGRLSVDPRALEASVLELRSRGFQDLWSAIHHVPSLTTEHRASLITLGKWAKFLCFPISLVDEISSMLVTFVASNEAKDQEIALQFIFAVLEGGGWTAEKVLSFSMGLSEHQLIHQAGKRKQTGRSKRRQQEMLSSNTSDDSARKAQSEVVERGEVACHIATVVWTSLSSLFTGALDALSPQSQVEGEGPIACMAAAAQSCLPVLLNASRLEQKAADLFRNLCDALVYLCGSRNQSARVMGLQPLLALHTAFVAKSQFTEVDQRSFIIDVLFQCLSKLASLCPYPEDYFADLRAESNTELEIHRNEVRYICRTLTGGEEDEVGSPDCRIPPSCLRLLCKVTSSLQEELRKNQHIPAETFLHTFSALAKPLNRLAKENLTTKNIESSQCLYHALEVLSLSLERVIGLFREPLQVQLVLPPSRTLNMAVASMAPLLSALGSSDDTRSMVASVLPRVARLSLLSLRFLPELATSEVLNYDIRGTMRGPGGEDHVGTLALMRLTTESVELTSLMAHAVAPLMNEFCELHNYLKSIEFWGESQNPKTTPKSRRVLIGFMCSLEVSSFGKAGASEMLENLVHSMVSSILSIDTSRLNEQSLFLLAEAAFDLASLSSLLPSAFFDHGEKKVCLDNLLAGGVSGYLRIGQVDVDGMMLQWNRLRGALYTLFLATAKPDFSETTFGVVRDLILAECGAVTQLLALSGGALYSSALFNDLIISPDGIPAGIFLMSLGKPFQNLGSTTPLPYCVRALCQVSTSVIEAMLLLVPFPSSSCASDPRCSLAEAWFSTLAAVAKSPAACAHVPQVHELLTESVVAAVALIFSPKLGSKDDHDGANFMSMDGPQSLALMDFLVSFLALGSVNLGHAVGAIATRFPVPLQGNGGDPIAPGLSIFLAATFRAVQGALPPWVVESIPAIFSNLYSSLGKNQKVLANAIQTSMELRSPCAVRGVEPGQLFSGYTFDGFSDGAKATFLQEVLDLAKADNAAAWKRLKHSVKAACGGKKKDTDYNQKPALTRWEFDRI